MHRRSLRRTLLLAFLFVGLLLLAVGGWTVQGVRHALGGGRGELAPAR
jgi:hypothetical protein